MNDRFAIHSISTTKKAAKRSAKHAANLAAKMPRIMVSNNVWAAIKHYEIDSGHD